MPILLVHLDNEAHIFVNVHCVTCVSSTSALSVIVAHFKFVFCMGMHSGIIQSSLPLLTGIHGIGGYQPGEMNTVHGDPSLQSCPARWIPGAG